MNQVTVIEELGRSVPLDACGSCETWRLKNGCVDCILFKLLKSLSEKGAVN